VPSSLEAVLHRLDVGLPVLLGDGDDDLVLLGAGHSGEPFELEADRAEVPGGAKGEGCAEGGVVTTRAGEEAVNPLAETALVCRTPGRLE